MANPLQQAGSQSDKPAHFAALHTNRFFTGLWTQRSPLRDAATPYLYEKFYSGVRFESMIDGSNMEVTNRLTLARRPGLSVYNSATFPAIDSFYSFRTFTSSSESIQVIADTATTVYNATGPSTKTSILSKSVTAGQAYFQGVGNILFIGDGIEQKKYLQNGAAWVTQNWGISMGSISGSNSTTLLAGAGANISVPGSSSAWSNPGNVSSAVNYSIANPLSILDTDNLQATSFGFGISATATMQGIQVSFDEFVTGAVVPNMNLVVQLLLNGAPAGNPKYIVLQSSPYSPVIGGGSDLWGLSSLTPSQVNASNFGVQFFAQTNSGGMDVGVRNVQVTAFYISAGPTVAVSGSAGSFSATTGYQYLFCYGNSLSGHVSNPTTASSSTGAFTNKLNVAVTVTASSDSQVNQIRVYRTKDGGSIFYELPTSPYPNTSTNITDNAADATLLTLNLAPTGTTNSPPPTGLINLTYHLQRVFGSVANTVYYSAGPTIVTGNPNEAWPPINFFIFPSAVVRMVPTSVGLLVFTVSDIYVISGQGTSSSSLFSAPYLQDIGLLSYNALDINGGILYLLTNQGMGVSLDPSSGMTEVGFPIGDKLQQFSPSASYVTWHVSGSSDKALYVSDGSTGWFRMNPTAAPESGLTWSPKATITGGCMAVQSIETSPGTHQLLVSPASGSTGPILFRDTTVSQDNGSSFTCSATIGSIVMALPGQLAELGYITAESKNVGSAPGISVLLDEISGTFESLFVTSNDPPEFPPSQSLTSNRYAFETLNLPAYCRHLQVKFSWPAENAADELYTYTIVGAHLQEK